MLKMVQLLQRLKDTIAKFFDKTQQPVNSLQTTTSLGTCSVVCKLFMRMKEFCKYLINLQKELIFKLLNQLQSLTSIFHYRRSLAVENTTWTGPREPTELILLNTESKNTKLREHSESERMRQNTQPYPISENVLSLNVQETRKTTGENVQTHPS
ncbi:hypothetical protein J6590_052451 [Homalodisca vitripennis]|nr:hypothetical protein J6590_052451 [Homalodisca vitripennis]